MTELVDSARTWVAGNLPIAVGGLVAFLVLTFLCVNAALRRRALDPNKLATANANALTGEKALSWEPAEQSYADLRGAVRRDGQPVRVTLVATTFRNETADGYVIDRSTGGLKVAAQVAVAPGTTMQIRAVDAPDTIGFVTLIVRSCRKTESHYELGCEFEKTPPWNVLLLFG
ncbi:MAG: PilZ domain-containing protein [Planctomycetes bacterium]|nr:PilZ domain-containing protein [Planctomycetota bacterium]